MSKGRFNSFGLLFLLTLISGFSSLCAQSDKLESNTYTLDIQIDPGLDITGKIFFLEDNEDFEFQSSKGLAYIISRPTDHPQHLELCIEQSFGVECQYLFVSTDTLTIKIITEDSQWKYRTEVSSSEQLRLKAAAADFYEVRGDQSMQIRTRDSVYMDSIITQVLPDIRRAELKAYQVLKNRDYSNSIKAFILFDIFHRSYEDMSTYIPISDTEIAYFKQEVNALLENGPATYDLELLAQKLEMLLQEGKRFHDDLLIDNDGSPVVLGDVLSNNDYVLINIWVEFCGPCRKFNKEIAENYESLRAQDIQIVNVNADYFSKNWLAAATEDNIQGLNLYTAPYSVFFHYYNPENLFPQKYLYNRKGEFLGSSVSNIEELLQLTKQ